jgi:hypothetical protein
VRVERPDNLDIDPPPRRRLDRVRDVLRKYWARDSTVPVSKPGWHAIERELREMSRQGSHEVIADEAAQEVERAREFLADVQRGHVPRDALPDGLLEDAGFRDAMDQWLNHNRESIDLLRREVDHFAELRGSLSAERLWGFVERSHSMRETLAGTLREERGL